jgi:hypothetical protein
MFSQMNYEHVHIVIYFEGIAMCDYPARGEMDPAYHDGCKAFKTPPYTSINLKILF